MFIIYIVIVRYAYGHKIEMLGSNLNDFRVLEPGWELLGLAEDLEEGCSQSTIVVAPDSAQTLKRLSYCFIALKAMPHVSLVLRMTAKKETA